MVIAALALLSCARRTPDTAAVLAAHLRRADRAWEDRGDGGLEPVGSALLEAWRLAPNDPEVGWRLVRWRVAEGLAASDARAAREAYAQGREQGTACLDADPVLQKRRLGNGWADALEILPPERAACAGWLGLAWVRWIGEIGPEAATLDLTDVDAILAAAEQKGAGDPAGWATGLLAGMRPTWAGQDPQLARRELEGAATRDPDSVVRWADLYRWGLLPGGEVEQAEQLRKRILAMDARTPEDRAAQDRLREGR